MCECVGVCYNEKVGVGFGINGGFNVIYYFCCIYNFFIRVVIIVFLCDLVFYMYSGCVCFFYVMNGFGDVKSFVLVCVDIYYKW